MIKKAKIIYPRKIGSVDLKYLPNYNDRHTFHLSLWGTIDNEYKVSAIFFETENKFAIVFDLKKPNNGNNLDLKTLVVIGVCENSDSIQIETKIERLPSEYKSDFTHLNVPVLPRWGEFIIVRKMNKILLLTTESVTIRNENKPLVKLDCSAVFENEEDILKSYGIVNLQWNLTELSGTDL